MVLFEKVSPEQVGTLREFSLATFRYSFYHLNTPENYELYVSRALNEEILTKELNEPDSAFYFGYLQEELVCYFKVNFNLNSREQPSVESLEIQRIYVSPEHLSKGIGAEAVKFIKKIGHDRNYKSIWLGVWEHNPKAIQFYERQGFEIVGHHGFHLGNEAQTDLIMECIL